MGGEFLRAATAVASCIFSPGPSLMPMLAGFSLALQAPSLRLPPEIVPREMPALMRQLGNQTLALGSL